MKTIYTTILLFTSLAASAQFDPTDSATDTSVTFGIAETKLNLGTAGTGKYWDFSKLVVQDTSYDVSFIPTKVTPGFSFFPTSNSASRSATITPKGTFELGSNVAFGKISKSVAEVLGAYDSENGIQTSLLKFRTPQKSGINPMAYNEQFNYIIDYVSENIIPKVGTSKTTGNGSGTVKFDATGTVLFPGSKVAVEASRFYTSETVVDTIYEVIDGENYTVRVESKNTFYDISGNNTVKQENLNISTRTSTTTILLPKNSGVEPMTETVVDISYSRRTNFREIKTFLLGVDSEEVLFSKIKFYPNPSSGTVHISGIETFKQIEVLNATGTLLSTFPTQSSIELPAESGLYLIKTILQNGNYKIFKVNKM